MVHAIANAWPTGVWLSIQLAICGPASVAELAIRMRRPVTMTLAMAMRRRFQYGRVSFTPYAVFSAPISPLKRFEPDQRVRIAPIEMSPGALGANTVW